MILTVLPDLNLFHPDKEGNTMRFMFYVFSYAFKAIQLSMLCEKLQKKYRWMALHVPELLTTSQIDHIFFDWRVVCWRGWTAAQEHHRGLYSHCFSSLSTPQTSSTTQNPVISRNTLMTQQLFCVSVMNKTGQSLCGMVWKQSPYLVCKPEQLDYYGFSEDYK